MFGIWEKYIDDPYRKMGFYGDQKGILRRYKREKKYWEAHLLSSKQRILDSAATKAKKKVAILGSGWLLDVPINELLESFSEVWLLDIFHPKPIVDKFKKNNKVHFVISDISGFALPLYSLIQLKKKDLASNLNFLQPELKFNLNDFDYVVSCNILDQLDDLLISFAQSKIELRESDEMEFRKRIQTAHIQSLPVGKSILLTDTEELNVNPNNEITRTTSLLHIDTKTYNKLEEWIWKFDNFSTYRTNAKTWFKVSVYEI